MVDGGYNCGGWKNFTTFYVLIWLCICCVACREMAEAQTKEGPFVPESVLKKQKRNEEWALKKKEELAVVKKKNAVNRKLSYNRAKLYAKEYEEQVTSYIRYIDKT